MIDKSELQKMNKKERKKLAQNLRLTQEKGEKRTKLFFTVGIIIFIALSGAGLWFLAEARPDLKYKELGETFTELKGDHIAEGSPRPEYNSNPPTSGPMYEKSTDCKVYTETVKDESVMHSLEHGAVWLTYKDKNDAALAEQLKKIVEDQSKVILSPRAANESKIAVASWNRLLKLDSIDEEKIVNYIKLYKSSKEAPEGTGACSMG